MTLLSRKFLSLHLVIAIAGFSACGTVGMVGDTAVVAPTIS